jgi:hypothetical protein
MFLFFILLVFFLYYLDYIDAFRYIRILNEDISYYDNRYLYLPSAKERIVISLTTLPNRIFDLKPTLISLLDSTYKVDKIYVNIPYETLKGQEYVIPDWLTRLHNVYINRVSNDYGPATKLLPTLNVEKDWIIVCDDDVIYGSRMVESYIQQLYRKEPVTIFGANIVNGIPEDEVPTYLRFRGPKWVDLVMGHNSFLIHANMFSSDVFSIPKDLIWTDDVWFSGMLKRKIYSLGFTYKNIPMSKYYNTGFSLSGNVNADNENNRKAIEYFESFY